MHEEPAASVHEKTALRGSVVSFTWGDATYLELTRGQEIDTGNGLVADCDVSSESVDGQSGEATELVELSSVGCAHSQLHLGNLGHDAEETHVLLTHQHRSLKIEALLLNLGEHIFLLINIINHLF